MPHHPPLIFWLLLAATICVDVVAIFTLSPTDQHSYALDFYLGLAFGQLAAAVAWCIFKADPLGFSWLLPYFGCVVAGLFAAPDRGLSAWNHDSIAYSILFSLYVTLLFVLLWLLKQSISQSDRVTGLQPWQLSMKHLLAVTAVVAVLGAAITSSAFFTRDSLIVVPWTINHLCVAVIVILLQTSVRYVGRRVIGTLISAIITWVPLSFTVALISRSTSDSGDFLVMNLIQGLVLLLWLDLGGIIAPSFESVAAPATPEMPVPHKPTER